MGSVQRGGVIRRNDNGTLERIGKTNTYVGSATLPDGKVLTKRFRCEGFDEEAVSQRWLKWQGRKIDVDDCYEETDGDDMGDTSRTGTECPLSGYECRATCPMYSMPNRACSLMMGGVALYNISENLMKLDASESIELLAMAVGEIAKVSTAAGGSDEAHEEPAAALTEGDGLDAYLEGKTFLDFVNLHSKTVNSDYGRFCDEKGFPRAGERDLVTAVKERFPELKGQGVSGGTIFKAA